MSYNEKSLTKLSHLKQLAQKIGETCATKEAVNKLSEAVDGAAAASSALTRAMYQAPAAARYRTGPMTGETVGSLLDDDTLAGLTPGEAGGEGRYDFVINGVTTGTYTKETRLSDIMNDINSSAEAGVRVSYSENRFTFTAKEAGGGRIELGGGLAHALFGPADAADPSSISFAGSYGLGGMPDGMSLKLSFSVPGSNGFSVDITKETAIQEVINKLNNSPLKDKASFSYSEYTGQIEAADKNGAKVDMKITDSMGGNVEFDVTKAPDVDYTAGKAAVFTAIKVNGAVQPVVDKAVNIAVPTKVSALTNDSGFQTGAEVSAAISTAMSKSGHAVFEKADAVPDAAAAQENVLYLVMNRKTKHYDIYAKVGEDVVLLDDTTVDLSGYVEKEEGKGLSSNDFTDELKAKLEAGPEIAADGEVAEMLAEVFSAAF